MCSGKACQQLTGASWSECGRLLGVLVLCTWLQTPLAVGAIWGRSGATPPLCSPFGFCSSCLPLLLSSFGGEVKPLAYQGVFLEGSTGCAWLRTGDSLLLLFCCHFGLSGR